MAIHDLKAQIARLPEQPGVYLYFNQAGDTVYVGKARALRDRVRSYLGAWGMNPRTDALLEDIVRLEVIVTDSVMEALALENNLIKQRSPKYNILLRDDKNYPYLQLTTGERFPRVLVARRVEKDGHVYAGPFLPAKLARRTMALTHRLFGIRSCNEVITGKRGRPCLEYDIHRCIAPCVDTICSEAEYARAVEDTRLFLEGRTEELAGDLRTRMADAAAAERFEQAGQLRDAMRTVQTLVDRHQKMAAPDLSARDVFGLKLGPAGAVVQIFLVRGGRVVDRVELVTEAAEGPSPARPTWWRPPSRSSTRQTTAPPEVHVPVARRSPRRSKPCSGRPRQPQGADRRAQARRETWAAGPGLAQRGAGLRERGSTPRRWATTARSRRCASSWPCPALPRRIDCFDISTIQGSDTVAVDGGLRRRPDEEGGVQEVQSYE